VRLPTFPRSKADPFAVTTGHSRSKNGVALLAYDPVVHAESTHGLPDQVFSPET
jgi:hypothetical protein